MKLINKIGLALLSILILVWSIAPIYHMVLIALLPPTGSHAGGLLPRNPTLENFRVVLTQNHPFVRSFLLQMVNSAFVAVAATSIVLFISTCAVYAIRRMKIRGGAMLSNFALAAYLIPAAFLAIPFYRLVADYGLLDSRWSLIFAIVTFATPYAIWVLAQYSTAVPFELDEAARIDGATPPQILYYIFAPLIRPALVAVGSYSFFLSWNEYLFAFMLLSQERTLTVPVVLGQILTIDDAPWTLAMAAALIYALPPVAIYYVFRKHMSAGLTSGAVRG